MINFNISNKLIALLIVFITINDLEYSMASLDWLSIAKEKSLDLTSNLVCDQLSGWSRQQKNFCKKHFAFTESIWKAAKLTLSECQQQFKSRRWNCSTADSPRIFAKLPETGMREAAYIYALSSAALSYQITSACMNGLLTDCGCSETKSGTTSDGHKWSGCSDNIAYGMAVSESFLEPRIRKKLKIMLLNLHNFETGRQMIQKNMVKQCKCHGISGSCEVKTCWKAMPPFNVISNKLKAKYDEAIQVEVKTRINTNNKHRLISKDIYDRQISKTDLVYTRNSPSFCKPNRRLAFYGTSGRICSKSSRGVDNCDTLCCGRPYRTKLEVVKYKCNCVFNWCCSVTCQECESIQQISKCL